MTVHKEVGQLRLDTLGSQILGKAWHIGCHIGVLLDKALFAACHLAGKPLDSTLSVIRDIEVVELYGRLEVGEREDILGMAGCRVDIPDKEGLPV